MKWCALVIFSKRDFLHQDPSLRVGDHAWDGCGLVQSLLLHQSLERTVAAATGRHFEHSGFLALTIEDGPDMKGLDEATPCDGFGEFLNGDAGLHAPDIGLAEH